MQAESHGRRVDFSDGENTTEMVRQVYNDPLKTVRRSPSKYAHCCLGLIVLCFGVTSPAKTPDGGSAGPADPTSLPASVPFSGAGVYAASLTRLSSEARALEGSDAYTYCLRAAANYSCPEYDRNGRLRFRKVSSVQHGTAFVYRIGKKASLLLTNDHVVAWPTVTEASGKNGVKDVPAGCKLAQSRLTLVQNDDDQFKADDIEATLVVTDPQLDAAVIRAVVPTKSLPFSIGQSSALQAGDAVLVRGYPLSAFQGVSSGKVMAARDRDTEDDWDHIDFVISAPLSEGNSGSPVLAVSNKTGALELVGLFHAAYSAGEALNVAVGIDEVRQLMTTLKVRTKRPTFELLGAARNQFLENLRTRPNESRYVAFGGQVLKITPGLATTRYLLFPKTFPEKVSPALRLHVFHGKSADRVALVEVLGAGNEVVTYPFATLSLEEQAQMEGTMFLFQYISARALVIRALNSGAQKSKARHEFLLQSQRDLATAERQARRLVRGLKEFRSPPPPPAAANKAPVKQP